jgi:malonyl CoA-acyl carrier protein transacylase
MATGIETFIDVGPGKVLSRLVKRISQTATVIEAEHESVHA